MTASRIHWIEGFRVGIVENLDKPPLSIADRLHVDFILYSDPSGGWELWSRNHGELSIYHIPKNEDDYTKTKDFLTALEVAKKRFFDPLRRAENRE